MIIADNQIANCEIIAPVEIFQEYHQSSFISLPIFALENAVKLQIFYTFSCIGEIHQTLSGF